MAEIVELDIQELAAIICEEILRNDKEYANLVNKAIESNKYFRLTLNNDVQRDALGRFEIATTNMQAYAENALSKVLIQYGYTAQNTAQNFPSHKYIV